ncbi:hypothetical protein E2C01_075305 [Portunus trituberculatus]|uniref:Uncharacterized protein n=1 Tax=Portunus trituberculatus TaxID=210409 RepID=A0A5B7IIT0_PORTR|nr:hypothetical protein [Portunus trituberculatus]
MLSSQPHVLRSSQAVLPPPPQPPRAVAAVVLDRGRGNNIIACVHRISHWQGKKIAKVNLCCPRVTLAAPFPGLQVTYHLSGSPPPPPLHTSFRFLTAAVLPTLLFCIPLIWSPSPSRASRSSFSPPSSFSRLVFCLHPLPQHLIFTFKARFLSSTASSFSPKASSVLAGAAITAPTPAVSFQRQAVRVSLAVYRVLRAEACRGTRVWDYLAVYSDYKEKSEENEVDGRKRIKLYEEKKKRELS